jgi:hypothetical protein
MSADYAIPSADYAIHPQITQMTQMNSTVYLDVFILDFRFWILDFGLPGCYRFWD